MTIKHPFSVIGSGMALPKQCLSSAQLEQRHGIPQGWAERRSGVKTRYHAQDESLTDIGAAALADALEEAKITLGDLDMILVGGAAFDHVIPNNASMIKAKLSPQGNHHVACLDIDCTCLSFVAGVEMAAALLDGKRYQHIAVVGADISSKNLNPANWETISLFGDAAAAAILAYDPSYERGLIHTDTRHFPEGVCATLIEGGGLKQHMREVPYDPITYSFKMNGKKLLKLASQHLPPFFESFFQDLDISLKEVDRVIPHQASRTGLALFQKLFHLPPHQVVYTLEDYGNCVSASIPLSFHLARKQGLIKSGDTCLLCGTSAGFSIGGVLLKV